MGAAMQLWLAEEACYAAAASCQSSEASYGEALLCVGLWEFFPGAKALEQP